MKLYRTVTKNVMFAIVAILLALQVQSALAKTYYVMTSGNDMQDGSKLDSKHAWLTVVNAAKQAKAGDTVLVGGGTYTNASSIAFANSGTASAPIVFKPVSGQHVVLQSSDWATVVIDGKSYIEFDSFEITSSASGDGGSGIAIDNRAHNVKIIGNYIHDCGVAGVGSFPANLGGCDYLAVEYNTVVNCCRQSGWHGSGITFNALADTNSSDTGFHNFIDHNIVHDCAEGTVWNKHVPDDGYGGPHTDGNGIIVDTCGDAPRTYIGNNVSYHNGGRGVYAYLSNNCLFEKNTCYMNMRDSVLSKGGELAAGDAWNNVFSQNIAYAYGGPNDLCNVVFSTYGHTSGNNTFTSNCYYNGDATYGSGDFWANPLFVNAGAGNFILSSGSPASGLGAYPVPGSGW